MRWEKPTIKEIPPEDGWRKMNDIENRKVFVEVGSCDFDTNLPLLDNGWCGIFVEPSPKYNKQLSKLLNQNPNRHRARMECSAISDYDGTIEFTQAKDMSTGERISDWRRGISSITADNHKGERMFDIEDNAKWIDEVLEVPCMTLDSLIDKYKLPHINYLKIDTEGHETNILESYSFKIKPAFIKLEHAHIDDIYVSELLRSQGYLVYVESVDMYAIR